MVVLVSTASFPSKVFNLFLRAFDRMVCLFTSKKEKEEVSSSGKGGG